MKNLNTLEKNNLDSITIYNIIWDRRLFDSNLKEEITLKFVELIGFDEEKCNINSKYFEFFKNYLQDKDKDRCVDNFSFFVTGKDGLNYKSHETILKDDNSLNAKGKNIFQ